MATDRPSAARPLTALIGLIAAFAANTATSSEPESPTRREVGTLVYDNIPEATAELRASIQRYQSVRAAGFLDWLPDGSMLIATRFGETTQLHRVAHPGGARTQLTFFDEPVAGAVASPTKAQFIFRRDSGGAEYYQGYLADLRGNVVQITDPGTRNQNFTFSDDGKRVAWARAKPGQAKWDIMMMSIDNPTSREVAYAGSAIVMPLDFSPDGRRLLFQNIAGQSFQRYVLDLDSGRAQQIEPQSDKTVFSGGEFTADGESVLLLTDDGGEFSRLVRYDLKKRRYTALSPADLQWDVESYSIVRDRAFDVSNDGRLLAYTVNEGGVSKLTLLDLETNRALPAPDLGNAVVSRLQFSPDGARLAIGYSTPASQSDVWSWDLAGKRLERWTDSELGGLDAELLPEPELIHAKSFDGLDIPAFLYRPKAQHPPGNVANAKRPVIIYIHGGPEAQFRPWFTPRIAYFTNELGAVVMAPNVRGSTGYGRTYEKLDNAEKREDSVKDIGALLDWIARQPDLDSERVVVYGGSYGGYMVLASLAHFGERLAGGVDIVGISNWITFLRSTEGYVRNYRRSEYGDERDPKMQALFERISPVNMAERITQPLLVIQGANDPRVPQPEADQIVRKLREQGGEVWYLLAKDEGHGFRKKQNQQAQMEVEMSFLSKLLGVNAAR